MDSYCDINNAYSNKGILNDNFNSNASSSDLEKLARQVNNSKKSKSKDIYRQYRKGSDRLDKGAQSFNQFLASQADKGTKISPYHLNATMGVDDVSDQTLAQKMAETVTASGSIPKSDTRKGAKKPLNGFYSAQGDYAEFNMMGQNDQIPLPSTDNQNKLNNLNNINEMNMGNFRYQPKNMSETLIGDIMTSKRRKKLITDDGSDGISLDTPSDGDSNSSESSFSSMTWDTKEIDKQIKSKSKFNDKKRSKRHKCMDFDLDSVDSLESLDSGESLLRHIRFCKECKDKVMGLIRKHKTDSIKHMKDERKRSKCAHILDSVQDTGEDDSFPLVLHKSDTMDRQEVTEHFKSKSKTSDDCQDNQSSIRLPEIKEIVTVCLIGFLIIVILDLMMRNK